MRAVPRIPGTVLAGTLIALSLSAFGVAEKSDYEWYKTYYGSTGRAQCLSAGDRGQNVSHWWSAYQCWPEGPNGDHELWVVWNGSPNSA